MHGNINILTNELISQIAAGEVIERPASCVKELLENSLDAEATMITLEVEDGGLKKIRVSDNGIGIRASEARLAFKRHATSKIARLDDLFNIRSLGFRGEALASIASIARVIMKTRHKDERVGSKLEIDGGKEISFEDDACKIGTDISIYGLFHHTPARKKYMKTERTEYGRIFEMVTQIALAHPEVGFRLMRDGNEIFDLPSKQVLKERIRSLFGGQTADALVPVSYKQSNLKINGFVGKPELARSSKKYQFVFVNGRAIGSAMIGHAVKEAFHSLLMHEKYPWYLLDIKIDPDFVDVNVHPRKLEVKFVNQQEVYKAVRGSVHHALEGEMLAPVERPSFGSNNINTSKGWRNHIGMTPKAAIAKGEMQPGETVKLDLDGPVISPGITPRFDGQRGVNADRTFANRTFNVHGTVLRPLAQIAASYIVAESEDGLVLIDQHAAHERVRYMRLMEELANEKVVSQKLLTPLEMDLGVDSARIVEGHLDDFNALGFEIEPFGDGAGRGSTFLVRAVPTGIERREPEQIVREVIADITEEWKQNHVKNVREFLLTYTACRGAIKFGDRLTMQEMEALVADMEKTKHSTHCPHGRPAIVKLTFDKLEEMFKRKNF